MLWPRAGSRWRKLSAARARSLTKSRPSPKWREHASLIPLRTHRRVMLVGEAPIPYSKILIRATNWVGDAVMSLPALAAIRSRFPEAEIVVLARPWVADLYAGQSSIDRVIVYQAASGLRDWPAKWRLARSLRLERFD